ncbi:MAG: GNAT family N-acetyltransferase [Candidatus Limnocylindrales bacterium]
MNRPEPTRDQTCDQTPAPGSGTPLAAGRVAQVNVSAGGVPKHPVAGARVGPLGLDGDRHRDDLVHGGPHRAVCLFGQEAIERVAGEGHPIEPGSVGENLTTEGIEWSRMPSGVRIEVGDEVVLELSAPANPCGTIVDAFREGRSGRISILRFPSDSRMYARVLREGIVRTGDPIRVLPPLGGSLAATHSLLDLLDAVERHAYATLWASLAATGRRIEIVDRGDMGAAACPSIPSSAFNRALGHRQLPHLVDRLAEVYRRSDRPGWIVAATDEPPWPGAVADAREGGSDIFHAALGGGVTPIGLTPMDDPAVRVREIGADRAAAWADVIVVGFGLDGPEADAWRDLASHLAAATGEHLVLAERDGRPIGAAALFTRRRVGLLTAAAVVPTERGRGVHAALIAARLEMARAAGCHRVMATASSGGPAERNLRRLGFERIWRRSLWSVRPGARPARR